MAGTDVSSVTSHFPKAQNGFATTLGTTIAHGASTVVLASTGNYANGDVVVLVIEPTSLTAKEVFTGTINTGAVSVTGCVWTVTAAGNPPHTAGVAIVDYVTATHISMMTKGLLVAHSADGTHKSGATYPLPIVASFANANHDHTNSAGGGAIGTGAVSGTALATSAITLGYAQITADFTTASATAVQVTGLTATVTIPTGGRRIKVTVFGYRMFQVTANTVVELTLWDGTVGSGTQLQAAFETSDLSNGQRGATLLWSATPAAGSKTYNVGIRNGGGSSVTLSAGATAPAFILVEAI